MTSRDYDVMPVMLQYPKSSYSKSEPGSTIRVDPVSTLS